MKVQRGMHPGPEDSVTVHREGREGGCPGEVPGSGGDSEGT